MDGRACGGCGRDLARKDYGKNQWKKGAGVSRCKQCVRGTSSAPAGMSIAPWVSAARHGGGVGLHGGAEYHISSSMRTAAGGVSVYGGVTAAAHARPSLISCPPNPHVPERANCCTKTAVVEIPEDRPAAMPPPAPARSLTQPPVPAFADDEPGPPTSKEVFEVGYGPDEEDPDDTDDDAFAPLLKASDSSSTAKAKLDPLTTPPPSIQLIIIPLIHFLVGISNNFPVVAARRYKLEELTATPATQSMMGVLCGMAWNLKVLLAFTSDSFPIMGQRRKPYLILGITAQTLAWLAFYLVEPSIANATLCDFTATMGQVLVGVMCDTLVVENMAYEGVGEAGGLQTNSWIALSVGGLIGQLSGGWVLEFMPGMSNRRLFGVNAMMKILLLGTAILVRDLRVAKDGKNSSPLRRIRMRAGELWYAMQENNVWKPVIFIFMFALVPSNHDAFVSFLLGDPKTQNKWPEDIAPLAFTDSQFAYLGAIGTLGTAIGGLIYKKFCRDVSWHRLFFVTIILSSALSASQLVLIYTLNRKWGISDIWFALGDETINDVCGFLLSMPMLVLMAKICPPNVAASVYALVTSLQMVGGSVGGTFTAYVTQGFGITLDNFGGLGRLTTLTSLLRLTSLLFIPFVPDKPELCRSSQKRSVLGATVLNVLLFGGVGWSVTAALHKLITNPYD